MNEPGLLSLICWAKVSQSPQYRRKYYILNRRIVVTDGGHFLEDENEDRS